MDYKTTERLNSNKIHNYMRHPVLLFVLTIILATSCGISNKMMVSTYSNGYWGNWEDLAKPWRTWAYQGSIDDFIVYDYNYHPSNYVFKLEVQNMTVTNDTKTNMEANRWYEYWGTISFDENVDWNDFAKYTVHNFIGHYHGVQKKTVKVTVMKKSSGYIYNIISGDVGFGITIPWQHAK